MTSITSYVDGCVGMRLGLRHVGCMERHGCYDYPSHVFRDTKLDAVTTADVVTEDEQGMPVLIPIEPSAAPRQKKVHMRSVLSMLLPACGSVSQLVTKDKSKVTCKRCLRTLE